MATDQMPMANLTDTLNKIVMPLFFLTDFQAAPVSQLLLAFLSIWHETCLKMLRATVKQTDLVENNKFNVVTYFSSILTCQSVNVTQVELVNRLTNVVQVNRHRLLEHVSVKILTKQEGRGNIFFWKPL